MDIVEEKVVQIPIASVTLEGSLAFPEKGNGMVIFAHGSGSSRLSPRNNFVAEVLRKKGLGTLLFDLLTEEEDQVYETRFNIRLLTERLVAATQWLSGIPEARSLNTGYFGSSTGAAAALEAAAQLGARIKAVVSRGGRPDMAIDCLSRVSAPVLLIVGGNDDAVIEMNEEAFRHIVSKKEMKIIPGATHLFEESGALEKVADLGAEWFTKHLAS